MKSLKAKFRKSDTHEWSKNDERLLSAVEHGEADKLASLLSKKGACPTKLDSEGKSALHVAASRGQAECLAIILTHGADVSLQDSSGFTALHLAAKNNHPDCAKKLLQNKCAVDTADSSGRTALHHAAASGHTGMVQLLCEHKSYVNLKDLEGFTPLLLTAVMLASESSCVNGVELLLQRGADLHMVDSLGHPLQHYAKMSGSSQLRTLHGLKLNEDRSSTPKKRKAPPPPISPIQSALNSSPFFTPTETPLSSNSDSSKVFKYKMEHSGNMDSSLVVALQTKIAALSLENQQLAQIIKKRPAPQGEEGQGSSRPNSIDSNASYHSTRADFELSSDAHIYTGEEEDLSEVSLLDISGSSIRYEMDEDVRQGTDREIGLLRDALESLQAKLLESRRENRCLQAKLNTDCEEMEAGPKSMVESLQKSKEELQERGELVGTGEDNVMQKFQYLKSCLEQEVKELKAKLAKSQEDNKEYASLIKDLKAQLKNAHVSEDEHQELKSTYTALVENTNQEKTLLIEKYKESQEEIKMLQQALRGTVPVEAAAKDFEEMKAELSEVIDGLQRRLLELSKSYSEAKNELNAAQSQLQAKTSEPKNKTEEHEQKIQELVFKMKDLQNVLKDTEAKHQATLKEMEQIRQEAENQAQSSVDLADHTQVVASMGSAIKSLESEVEVLKEQLAQRNLQVDALQNRLTVEQDVTPDDSLSRLEYEQMQEALEAEISHLKQLLKEALGKRDEMALEVAAAWQEVKDNKKGREVAQEMAACRERECTALNIKYREVQETTVQLKKQLETHGISERDKEKKIDELSKEVVKLKEALNSLSQLSYSSSSSLKRQQSQQVDLLQQQIKQLHYQLTESKKRHHEIVSVYRMHLLYAVQGQMDEDVQKALKQILVMCKIPNEGK
ncbi:hypothetical protein DNTS_002009 [Danionella cerebrum]|uniref:Uncharacterized protein n=1 Tax=Danionella cerebrum TaxID=2873325 RepID=A0A553RB51_9TELE|nr:hypothetical protein DNTS_002009 [Danionella translucida]